MRRTIKPGLWSKRLYLSNDDWLRDKILKMKKKILEEKESLRKETEENESINKFYMEDIEINDKNGEEKDAKT